LVIDSIPCKQAQLDLGKGVERSIGDKLFN